MKGREGDEGQNVSKVERGDKEDIGFRLVIKILCCIIVITYANLWTFNFQSWTVFPQVQIKKSPD